MSDQVTRQQSKSTITAILLGSLLALESQLAHAADGVVSSTNNAQQVAMLHWYQAGLTAQFAVGNRPTALAFDGEHVWVVNSFSNTITEVQASDGAITATVATSLSPSGIAFDGANI
jgi:YVTN family beta-propeller protein